MLRMVDRGGGPGFLVEASQDLRSFSLGEHGDLEGHVAIELGIPGQIDRPHRTLTEQLDDSVPTEVLRQL